MAIVRIIVPKNVEKTAELIEWELREKEIIAVWTEVARAASEMIKEMFTKAVEIVDFVMDTVTCQKPKLPKPRFSRNRIAHQNLDRKPRFAVRKIL